jgi:SAM-dependent methyltransferase
MGKRRDEAATAASPVSDGRLRRFSAATIAHYDRLARAFRDGTRDHDVSQNYAALLDAIWGDPPYAILDLGCGPGRDLRHFRALGHDAVGLDGSKEFVAMARASSGCEVLHQDFLAMALPKTRFPRRVCKRVAVPRSEPGAAEGIARTQRSLARRRRSLLLKHTGQQ